MIRADEVRPGKSQIEFALAALEGNRLRPKEKPAHHDRAQYGERIAAPAIHISGSQLLVGFASCLCLVILLTWGIVGQWLFAP